MKTGVGTSACPQRRRPRRAAPSVPSTVNEKGVASDAVVSCLLPVRSRQRQHAVAVAVEPQPSHTASRYTCRQAGSPVNAATSISSDEPGRWKFVSSPSAARTRSGGAMNRRVVPATAQCPPERRLRRRRRRPDRRGARSRPRQPPRAAPAGPRSPARAARGADGDDPPAPRAGAATAAAAAAGRSRALGVQPARGELFCGRRLERPRTDVQRARGRSAPRPLQRRQ